MSECQIEGRFPTRGNIPVEFGSDLLLCFQIKIQPTEVMKHPNALLEKSFEPGLFRLAALANDIKSVKARGRALALSHTPLAEMMFDPHKLEAILKRMSGRRKSARHTSTTGLNGI